MKYSTLEESPVAGLHPALFWKHFYEITRIPRASGNEKGVGDYLVNVAERLGLPHKRDEAGNVLISKPGTKGHENAGTVVLQSHQDMVCEKNKDVVFDFAKDPIKLIRDGDYIKADGTSLGADNGAGIAASLAVLESTDLEHPPIECLFTTDEETGMTGAKNMKSDFLKGKVLLNLDSEEEGDIYVGCAGGADNVLSLKVTKAELPAGTQYADIKLSGLKGGHSGLDIHEGRGNAIKMLARFLWNTADSLGLSLASFTGGSKRNAIPREAEVTVAVPEEKMAELEKEAAKWEKIFKEELYPLEDQMKLKVEKIGAVEKVLSKESASKLLDLIAVLPHGVLAMSRTLPNLVETSTNVAIIRAEGDEIFIDLSHRSSSASSLLSVSQRTESLARLCNLGIKAGSGYPGWQPNMSSKVLNLSRETYKELFGKDVHIKAIHAGLECGLIGEKYPGMDMISFGPTLRNVHSPDEVIYYPSVEFFWKFLVHLLKKLA
jgi:dipeptidase D